MEIRLPLDLDTTKTRFVEIWENVMVQEFQTQRNCRMCLKATNIHSEGLKKYTTLDYPWKHFFNWKKYTPIKKWIQNLKNGYVLLWEINSVHWSGFNMYIMVNVDKIEHNGKVIHKNKIMEIFREENL